MRIATDEALELARRYEASGGFETTLGDSLRPRVRDELNRIARRTVNWSARDFIITILCLVATILCLSILVLFTVPGATMLDAMIRLYAMFLALGLATVLSEISPSTERHSGRDDAKDYGKLLAAYRMLGGDESQLKPYAGIDTAERVAAGLHERPAVDDGAASADAEPRDVFSD